MFVLTVGIVVGLLLGAGVLGAIASRRDRRNAARRTPQARTSKPGEEPSSEGRKTGDEMTAEQAKVLSKFGRLLLFGRYAKAIQLIEAHLAQAEGAFRLMLLSQRGGYYTLTNRYDLALADYEACVQARPDIAMLWSNLADLYYTLGREEEAVRCARKILDLKADPDARRTAEQILRRGGVLSGGTSAGRHYRG